MAEEFKFWQKHFNFLLLRQSGSVLMTLRRARTDLSPNLRQVRFAFCNPRPSFNLPNNTRPWWIIHLWTAPSGHLEHEVPHLAELRQPLLEALNVLLSDDDEPLLPPAEQLPLLHPHEGPVQREGGGGVGVRGRGPLARQRGVVFLLKILLLHHSTQMGGY